LIEERDGMSGEPLDEPARDRGLSAGGAASDSDGEGAHGRVNRGAREVASSSLSNLFRFVLA
jgi:hypothetical protein